MPSNPIDRVWALRGSPEAAIFSANASSTASTACTSAGPTMDFMPYRARPTWRLSRGSGLLWMRLASLSSRGRTWGSFFMSTCCRPYRERAMSTERKVWVERRSIFSFSACSKAPTSGALFLALPRPESMLATAEGSTSWGEARKAAVSRAMARLTSGPSLRPRRPLKAEEMVKGVRGSLCPCRCPFACPCVCPCACPCVCPCVCPATVRSSLSHSRLTMRSTCGQSPMHRSPIKALPTPLRERLEAAAGCEKRLLRAVSRPRTSGWSLEHPCRPFSALLMLCSLKKPVLVVTL
mmetsp:Transcript_28017/g.60392  ORF Transcript_28017/g.60392 Transcript_28017/m.60392 type:complete len:294 (-) Transcript_28017:1120-2001(-)